MPEEIQENSKKTSKEIWLFLIFVDIVALCVFGFFVYRAFFNGFDFASLMPQSSSQEEEILSEETLAEDISVEDINIPEEEPLPSEAEQTPKEAPSVKEEISPAQESSSAIQAEPKRQSVFISGSGKTRKVTFKYYGDADKVSIVSGFTMRKPIALKKSGGVWSTTLVIYPGEYRYLYIVDGKEIPDPNAEQEDGRSILVVK